MGQVKRPVFIFRPTVPDIAPTLIPHHRDVPVVYWPCVTDGDYDRGVKAFWDTPATMVIIEHDIHVTDAILTQLLECPYPLCAVNYKLYPVSTGLTEPINAHRKVMRTGAMQWIEDGEPIADVASFGLVKFAWYIRQAIDLWEQGTWRDLDWRISKEYMAIEQPFHIHWPEVQHRHAEQHPRIPSSHEELERAAKIVEGDTDTGASPQLDDGTPDPYEGLTFAEAVERAGRQNSQTETTGQAD